MTEVKRGQIWRNIHGGFIVMDALETRDQFGSEVYAWWARSCTPDGVAFGDKIGMDPDGFPGPLWTLVGEA